MCVSIMRPTSRGYIALKSRDPRQHPIIQPRYLSTEYDRRVIRDALKAGREVMHQKAFDPYRARELKPGTIFAPHAPTTREVHSYKELRQFWRTWRQHPRLFSPTGDDCQTDEDLDNFIRNSAKTDYHPSCTCRMGSEDDPTAVVDNEARVIGVENLRVVDASIMPSIVSGNLNAPTVMIAEKAADMILGNVSWLKVMLRLVTLVTLSKRCTHRHVGW